MDLEQTVRAAFALREPRKDFEDAVMGRLSAATWRASQARPRRRRRFMALGALAAGSAGAAILVAWYSGSSTTSVTLPVEQGAAFAPLVMQSMNASAAASASALAPISPNVPNATEVSQLCAAAASAPPATATYTALVEPLRFQTDDPAIQSRVQEYYDLLLDQLRNVPGLALVGQEGQAATMQADFRITIDRDVDRDGRSPADHSGPWFRLQLETWNGPGFQPTSVTSQQVRDLDDNSCPARINCRSSAVSAAVMNIRARLQRPSTPAQVACENARREFDTQRIAQQRKADPRADLSMIYRGLELLATTPVPAMRLDLRSGMNFTARPELVAPLVTALREATDDTFRKELVTLLVVKFHDPAIRDAMAPIAGSSPDTLLRHVAERAFSGDLPWRDYVVAKLRDTSLPAAQRLEALYWMSDALPLDEPKMSAELAGVLTALQTGDGLRVLAELLAGTQQEVRQVALTAAAQQGQWAMKRIGSMNLPVAPELLIACFDAMPNYLTLETLATRRDDPRVTSKLESIAVQQTNLKLRGLATRYLSQPLDPQQPVLMVN